MTLRPMLLLLGVTAISSMMLLSCDSYERRMAKFEKTATEYKKTLEPNNQIIAERIDSIVQKVYYAIDADGDGTCENIKTHDYATGETKSILPESGKIEDYKFCGVAYSKSKLVEDRLFVEVVSNCMWEICDHGIFYIDVRNDSLHYVEQCTSADFDGSNKINIHKTYYVGEDEYGSPINKLKDYTLSTSLSDEAYADNRREQKRIEERLAEERRRREEEKRLAEERRRLGKERKIKIDYSLILNRAGFEDYAGSLQGVSLYKDGVCTKSMYVPNGKVWQLKSISYSGYTGSNPPRFYYCKNENGAFDVGLKELENGQVFYPFYPWGYTFWIMFDENRCESGRRTAEIVFMEKEY